MNVVHTVECRVAGRLGRLVKLPETTVLSPAMPMHRCAGGTTKTLISAITYVGSTVQVARGDDAHHHAACARPDYVAQQRRSDGLQYGDVAAVRRQGRKKGPATPIPFHTKPPQRQS